MIDNKIIQLDKDISNKIAAGEVVERPLAVVKELVENAIDAQATKITVEIKDAGKSLIRVTDNGHGIRPDDIVLAFERHSTSKIRTINDIYHISSLGFRGEALASISSVSNMEVISKHSDFDYGKKLVLSGGKIVENQDVGAPSGTTMMVKDLFFNTPARLKFMKSNNAELNAINDIMTKLAMSHPEVAFKYIVGGKNIFITPGNGKLYDVILNIYQRSLAKNLIQVDYKEHDIHLSGYVSTIEMTRGNRQYQIAFVNNRYVKSKTIEDAIATVYRTLIPHNRFAISFLNITIDPSLIDINIHPAKTEIRFHQEGVVKDLIYKALKYEINRYDMVPDKPMNAKPIENKEVLKAYSEVNRQAEKTLISKKPESFDQVKKEVKDFKFGHEKRDFVKAKEEQEKKEVLLESYKSLSENRNNKPIENQTSVKPLERQDKPLVRQDKPLVRQEKFVEDKPLIKESPVFSNKETVKESPVFSNKETVKPLVRETFKEVVYESPKPMFEDPKETIYDNLRYIGQIFNSYLIYEKNHQMYMIDQHAAHEKILYEKFLDDFRNKKMMTQMILEPIVVDINSMTVSNAMAHKDILLNLGFNIEPFGENAIVVREIPLGFDLKTAKFMINDLIEKLDFSLPKERFELALNQIATRSCKAAVKANDHLMDIEVEGLVNQLKGLNEPYTCPHGRPIIIKISRSEIERKFNRT
ncbi:DNA mismatch repair endonuclease MutL [Acidaminobacter sp. JC074]|uniref:DNA mismatch repair endonuclease MutL n=1 Tax=Acidaminobacter sp. JC074 TaxID=2530199 RepID=UPI001F11766D|nr:DNA mismatch repair endonuclease MutL [Acidaminobacter sp. JC074]MCH4888875.1 DNA mismatch repair endonuclease MutL [Acidaminobacter sp. JC074]